jgi:type VII secretion integral membrane protein EccD
VPAPTSGLARVTIRAPRRRLDLAIPHQVPLAELLPEVLRRAGEAGPGIDGSQAAPAGGWILRRGDGGSLHGETALAHQGVRDGDVLYLVPRNLTWPEPEYDDVIEEIAANAQKHGRTWDAGTTRVFALVAAALVLFTGLGVLVAAAVLLAAGTLLSRAVGDGVAGAAAGGFGLPYAAVGGLLLSAGNDPGLVVGPDEVLVGACALMFASVVGAVAIGHGLRVFTAGGTVALFGIAFAAIGFALSPSGSASILIVALVAGIGLAPLLAVRLGKLPLPVVTASPEIIATEPRPSRPTVLAAVVRADEILAGSLLGISISVVGCVAVLSATTGFAGPLLAGLASTALLLRSRLFPSIAARLPLLVSGLIGLALTAGSWASAAGSAAQLVGVALAFIAVVALLATAATAHRRRTGVSPYVGRMGDILDITTVIALAPVACAVLDLYAWVRGLASG